IPAALWAKVRSVLADPNARPVVVAGDDLGYSTRTLRRLAGAHAVPVFAEPSSALASHSRTIPAHAQVLDSPPAQEALARITHVIVSGRPTLSRPVARLLDRSDVERIDLPYDVDGLVQEPTDDQEPTGDAADTAGETGAPAEGSAWWSQWQELS